MMSEVLVSHTNRKPFMIKKLLEKLNRLRRKRSTIITAQNPTFSTRLPFTNTNNNLMLFPKTMISKSFAPNNKHSSFFGHTPHRQPKRHTIGINAIFCIANQQPNIGPIVQRIDFDTPLPITNAG